MSIKSAQLRNEDTPDAGMAGKRLQKLMRSFAVKENLFRYVTFFDNLESSAKIHKNRGVLSNSKL